MACAANPGCALLLFLLLQPGFGIRSRSVEALQHNGTPLQPVFTWLEHAETPLGPSNTAFPPRFLDAQLHRTTLSSGTQVSTRQFRALLGGAPLRNIGYHSHRLRGAADGDIESPRGLSKLKDLYGTEYIGRVGIGSWTNASGKVTPESELWVVYDTGSSDFWVTSDLCKAGPCGRYTGRRYNHSRSATFRAPQVKQEIWTTYGSGELRGILGVDEVSFGSLTVKQQTLGLITSEEGDAFELLPFDGIAGLGFPSLAAAAKYGKTKNTPVFDNLVQQNLLARPEFAFYLHPNLAAGGAVLWGGYDSRLFEAPMHWFPVVEERYWALDLVEFAVGNRSFHTMPKASASSWSGARPSADAFRPLLIVDSGTTFSSAAGQVWHAIQETLHPMKCSHVHQLPPVVYTIKDSVGQPQKILVPPEKYMVTSGPGNFCTPGFVMVDGFGQHDQSPMILGEIFMRHHFTVFSRDHRSSGHAHVGIARASHGASAQSFFQQTQSQLGVDALSQQ